MADTAAHHPVKLPTRLYIQLLGPLKAWAEGGENVLPRCKKAQAILVVLALAGDAGISRKQVAGLLWSKNSQPDALGRLRGALLKLRQALKPAYGQDDPIDLHDERIRLKAGALHTDLPVTETEPGAAPFLEIAADLGGLDPKLDAWLHAARQRLRYRAATRLSSTSSGPVHSGATRMAAVIGVGVFTTLGPGVDPSLSTGLADEISAALARLRGVVVIASTSVTSATAAGRNIQTDFGIEYIIDGTIYQQPQGLRAAVKLVDVSRGALVWSWSSRLAHDELADPQHDIAALIVASLEPEISIIQMRGRRDRGELDRSAYSLLLKAIASTYLLEREAFMQAGEFLNEVIALEPQFASAYSWLALWNVFLIGQGWARDPQRSIMQAGEAAEHAITLDPNDARGLAIAGHVRAFLHRRSTDAVPLYERALAVNPSLPLAWHLSGVACAYGGDLSEARRRLVQCRKLAPNDPHRFFADGGLTIVELLSGNLKAAVEIGRGVVQLHPRFSAGYKPYLAALGHLGELTEAVIVRDKLLVLEPDFNIKSFRDGSPFKRREHLDYYVAGLFSAKVPRI